MNHGTIVPQVGSFAFGAGMQGLNGMNGWIQNAYGDWEWVNLPNVGQPGNPNQPPVTVQTTVNGQPVSGSGHSTRDAILNLANNAFSSVMTYLNQGRQIQIAQLQYTGQLPGGQGGASGQGLTGAIASITDWASKNTGVVLIGGLVVVALMISPPGKRK